MMRGLVAAVAVALFTGQASAKAADNVTVLENESGGNEVRLLDNRFRIDYDVEQITLLFFREPGSPAVVLVQPDGSKLYAPQALKNKDLEWHDEVGYDLITIKNPTPGPWQVVGKIMPGSKVMVLGDITLDVDKLPPLLFRGETLKITGRVLNDGEQVKVGYFREVINMVVDFVSTNNRDYSNFGVDTVRVAEFKDDGQGFDERPGDAVFTGEFKLDFPAGEWRPELELLTPIIKRRLVQPLVIVEEPPFKFDLAISADPWQDHLLAIHLNEEKLKPETVLMQGRIFYPNGEEQMFSLPAANSPERELALKNYDWGDYSIEFSVFGSNINGREFMATLPNYTFNIPRPIEKVTAVPMLPTIEEVEEELPPPEPTMSDGLFYTLVALGNLLILLLGWLVIRIFVQKKPIRLPKFKRKKAGELQLDQLDELQNSTKSPGNSSKNDKSGEILNLSMSDD